MIDLRNALIIGGIPENENPIKLADIVEKVHDFEKQQKGKGIRSQLKILSSKQMIQRLSIALAQA